MSTLRRLALPLLVLFALAGCGTATATAPAASVATSSTAAAADVFPVTLDSGKGQITIKAKPSRIVSLSPSATELLYAMGAGQQVVAVDEFSNYPANAPKTTLSGFQPNVEAILAYTPDLVVTSGDTNGIVDTLGKAGVPVLVNAAPATIEAGYPAITALGRATGRSPETAKLIDTMKVQLQAAFDSAPKVPVRVYHELDSKLYAASSASFIGSVYTQLGAKNIADEADPGKTGYPQLTAEAILKADPQVIVITDQSGLTAADIAKRPGWETLSAVKNNHVVVVSADVSSRWGPRLPQLVSDLSKALGAVT